jgi:hypothetical protein
MKSRIFSVSPHFSDFRMASQYSFKIESTGFRPQNRRFVRVGPVCEIQDPFMAIGRGPVKVAPRLAVDDDYTPSMRGRLCPSLASSGVCNDGSICPYSHTVNEARSFNPNFKTKICDFAANGFCMKANQCRYAHSFSELGIPMGQTMHNTHFGAFIPVGRNVSSVSTVDVSADSLNDQTHNTDCGSDDELSPIVSSNVNSPSTRVCYVAPSEQRTVIPKRQRRKTRVVTVPSAFHYVQQLERMRAPTAYPFMQIPLGHPLYGEHPRVVPYGLQGAYYGNPMMYSVTSPEVIYED